MRVISAVVVVLFIFTGCNHKDTRPSTVLQPEVFAPVLADVHLAEAEAMGKELENDTVKATLHAQYRTIWEMHAIDSSQFYASMEWYQQHPAELHALYEQVHELLLLQQENKINK